MSTTTAPKPGDTYAGGEYIGTTPGGSEWVARGKYDGEAADLRDRLAVLWARYGRQQVTVPSTPAMSRSVDDGLDNDRANGHDVGKWWVTNTTVVLTRHAALLAAQDIEHEADDIEGFADLTDETEKLNDGLRDYLTAQRLKARKRWAARLMKGAGALVREGK